MVRKYSTQDTRRTPDPDYNDGGTTPIRVANCYVLLIGFELEESQQVVVTFCFTMK